MSHVDEKWVKAAMADDTMVVELLLQLHRPSPPLKPAAVKLDWSVRQRRSKSVTINKKPKNPAHRASPTTPLSWSYPTSASGGSGGTGGCGFEESSLSPSPKICNSTRSKVINGDSEKPSSKRSIKKKTMAQLVQEEKYLLKERIELNKEIVALRVNLENQRSTGKSLKKMKLELQPHSGRDTYSSSPEESVSGHQIPKKIIQPNVSGIDISLLPFTSNSCLKQNTDISSFDTTEFVLPDLNVPFEESSCL